MSKERNSKRDGQIEALHAALLALLEAGAVGSPAIPTTWVFASQTASGAWLFTYKTQEESPGEGWKRISQERIATVTGGKGYIRVEP